MIAVGYALQATLGTGTYADGLACLPTLPASMQVTVGPGSLVTMSTIDASAYGTIAADLDPLCKMGINPFGSTSFTITAPGTSGQSINYLIEAQLVEADGSPIALPYYNASNPSQPFTGPNNSQAQQNTVRTQRVGLQLKAGAPAGAGTQQTPGVDAGWVGLYTISVNFAQTSITSTAINVYPGAPFIGTKIPNLAPIFSPQLTGTGTSTTPPVGDNSNRIATTASSLAAHSMNLVAFTASGTFTVPANVTRVKVTVVGGGGGGASNGFAQAGGGGGAGGTSIGIYTVSGSVVVSVGAGGVGGTVAGTQSGSAGSTSSFGGFTSVAGGGSGNNTGVGAGYSGGFGGIATGGTINTSGGDGGDGGPSNITNLGGNGGASSMGGGGRAGNSGTSGGNADGGQAYGSGGGGGYGPTNMSGGAGRGGIVIVEWT